jgi:DNA polymerase-3 subunit beta
LELKARFKREDLANEFGVVSGWSPGRTTMDVLHHVKLTASGGEVVLEATDTRMGIRSEFTGDVAVQQEGVVLLPISRVGSILRESTDEHITIEGSDNGLVISGDGSNYKIQTTRPELFPSLPRIEESQPLTVSAEDLAMAIARTSYAVDVATVRYALGGIKLDTNDGDLVVVACDGRRSAIQMISMVDGGNPAAVHESVVVPIASAKVIQRSLEKGSTADLFCTSSRIEVRCDNRMMYTLLLEGRYPPWRRLIPDLSGFKRVDIPLATFQQVIRQAGVVTDKESTGISLAFTPGELNVSAFTAEVGESSINAKVDYEGERVKFILSIHFLNDALKSLGSQDTVSIYFVDSEKAVVIVCDRCSSTIMPIVRVIE